jgi:hypothetical protein
VCCQTHALPKGTIHAPPACTSQSCSCYAQSPTALSAHAFQLNPATFQELEDKVLRLLRESSGYLLDDEALIVTLNNARATSGGARAMG